MSGSATGQSWWVGAVVCLWASYALAGCCHPQPNTGVDLTFVPVVVGWLIARRGLKKSSRTDQHKVFFTNRRARDLGLANPSWLADPEFTQLKAEVDQELGQVEAFLSARIGTPDARGALFGGPDPKTPPHLPLERVIPPQNREKFFPRSTVAAALAATVPSAVELKLREAVDRRRDWAIAIALRAAAIEQSLWIPSAGSSRLDEAALDEILDRRIRAVERLRYNASAGAVQDKIGFSAIDRPVLPAGPLQLPSDWGALGVTDEWYEPMITQYRARPFETPSVPFNAIFRRAVHDLLADGSVNPNPVIEKDPSVPRFNVNDLKPAVSWYLNYATNEIDYNHWPGTRPEQPRSGALAQLWERSSKQHYGWYVNPVGDYDAAAIVMRAFRGADSDVPTLDLWERAWLHADGVMALLGLEALRFAKLRRTGNDTAFSKLADDYKLALDDPFDLRPGPKVEGSIFRGSNAHFENTTIKVDDLQVGDHVVMRDNVLLTALTSAWDSANLLVTDVGWDADAARVPMGSLRVQGFNTSEYDVRGMRVLHASVVDPLLASVRKYIEELIAGGSTQIFFEWDTGRPMLMIEDVSAQVDATRLLRLWSPYSQTFKSPGPWWVRIDLLSPIWSGSFATSIEEAVVRLPKSVAWSSDNMILAEDPTRPGQVKRIGIRSGFEPPPWRRMGDDQTGLNPHNQVFFPLYEPRISGGWTGYFEQNAERTVRVSQELQPLLADARVVPSLTEDAKNVRVVRPRVAPR